MYRTLFFVRTLSQTYFKANVTAIISVLKLILFFLMIFADLKSKCFKGLKQIENHLCKRLVLK